LGAYNELSGAYILKLYGNAVEQPKYSGGVYKYALVMEFMSRGSLTSVIQKNELSLSCKLDMAWHVASGMKKLHARHMIHRDIRPDNILVNEIYTAKISDMGIARSISPDEQQHLTIIGCPSYMPLEFYTSRYGQSLDVYTFGLTLYYLFTETIHKFDPLLRIISLTQKSAVFNELIVRCIDVKPKRRPSAVEIETTLNLYRRTFKKYIENHDPEYTQLTTDRMDEIFMKFYTLHHPQAMEALARQFRTPSPESDADEDVNFNTTIMPDV
jgi:serine/threonine protein kinase